MLEISSRKPSLHLNEVGDEMRYMLGCIHLHGTAAAQFGPALTMQLRSGLVGNIYVASSLGENVNIRTAWSQTSSRTTEPPKRKGFRKYKVPVARAPGKRFLGLLTFPGKVHGAEHIWTYTIFGACWRKLL
jgi:hypothetical protein